MRRLLLFLLLTAGLAAGGAWYLQRGTQRVGAPSERSAPMTEPRRPGPGDPPVVWVAGTLEEVGDAEIILREGDGPEVRLQRLAAGATRFLARGEDGWAEASASDAAGQPACVESFLDRERLVAIRVFVGASGCGPE